MPNRRRSLPRRTNKRLYSNEQLRAIWANVNKRGMFRAKYQPRGPLSVRDERYLGILANYGTPEQAAQAKELLVRANEPLVHFVARRYQRLKPSVKHLESVGGVTYPDLIQEGRIGLAHAVSTFDPDRGTKFSTHAHQWIRQAMSRAAMEKSHEILEPSRHYWIRSKVNKISDQFYARTGRNPTLDELAFVLKMEPKKLHKILISDSKVVSGDKPIGFDTTGKSLTLFDVVPSKVIGNPEEEMRSKSLVGHEDRLISFHLNKLTPQERRVVSLKYGLDGRGERSGAEIGRLSNLSRERIRQVESSAMKKMQASPLDSTVKKRTDTLFRRFAKWLTKRNN